MGLGDRPHDRQPESATGTRAPALSAGEAVERSCPSSALGGLTAAVEALDPAAGVDQLLLAREERVALVAQLDPQLGLTERVVNVLDEQRTLAVT